MGTGGHALVYKAIDVKRNQTVAMKKLNPVGCSAGQRDSLVSRFQQESLISKELSHPNIVKVFDAFSIANEHYIVMEFIEGVELDHYVFQKNLTFQHILDLFIQMADALAYVHAHHIIHRDIKPENFMVDHRNQVRLMDFGVAKQDACSVSSHTMDGSIMGTLAYMSPEQLQNSKNITVASDIYSFGVVLYQVLTAQLPFAANSIAELITNVFTQTATPPHCVVEAIPVSLSAVISQMLCKLPEDRFENMHTVKQTLERVRDSLPPHILSQTIQTLVSETETSDSFFDDFMGSVLPEDPAEVPSRPETPPKLLQKLGQNKNFLKYLSTSLITDANDDLAFL